jgi:hypothetical protein
MQHWVHAVWLRIQDNAQFTTYHKVERDHITADDADMAFDAMSEHFPWVTGWRLMALNIFTSRP